MHTALIDPRGLRDKTGAVARPVQIPWSCSRTGDCCRAVTHVTVTAEERIVLEGHALAAVRPLEFVLHPDEVQARRQRRDSGVMAVEPVKFYQLVAKPCPFLSSQGLCTIHHSRPFNCRRFMCGRVDVQSESFEEGGPMGCHNLSDRIATSLRFQEHYASRQRAAQKEWGLNHGWTK